MSFLPILVWLTLRKINLTLSAENWIYEKFITWITFSLNLRSWPKIFQFPDYLSKRLVKQVGKMLFYWQNPYFNSCVFLCEWNCKCFLFLLPTIWEVQISHPKVFYIERCSYEFDKIDRKTPVLEPPFL